MSISKVSTTAGGGFVLDLILTAAGGGCGLCGGAPFEAVRLATKTAGGGSGLCYFKRLKFEALRLST
jgi:hypothetical protein